MSARVVRSASALLLASVIALPIPAVARDHPPPPASLQGDAARPAAAANWQRAELYFGLGQAGADDADAQALRWQRFLDEEVTPRFPDGFSVLDVYGQWRRRETNTIERLNSKLLVILFQGAQHRADLDALRAAWKQRTGDQSVLLTVSAAEVSF